MRRIAESVLALGIVVGLALALGLAGCGKYGPVHHARPAPAVQPGAPAQTTPPSDTGPDSAASTPPPSPTSTPDGEERQPIQMWQP